MAKKGIHRKKQSNIKVLLAVFILIAVALILSWNKLVEMSTKKAMEKERQEWEQEVATLEQELADLTKGNGTGGPGDDASPEEAVSPLADLQIEGQVPKAESCEKVAVKIDQFFNYLDEQEYIKAYELKDGSNKHFTGMVNKVFKNQPVVVGETENLMTILKNTAHFYRTLGKYNVALIKEMLLKEGHLLEVTMALFYEWSLMGKECEGQPIEMQLPLENLYEYSSYFLNTMGGQAYLFRRGSRVRKLVKYYSILVLDRANTGVLNKYGIDIRPHIKTLLEEMEASETLVYREEYMRTLLNLQEIYRQQMGEKE